MSSTIGLGVPVPKMLPVTGTWALPFTAYLLLLSSRVVAKRIKHERFIGSHLSPDKKDKDGGSHEDPDPLFLETRCHMNFVENVPIAFILTALAELNGANRTYLNYAMAALLAVRIGHVELGLRAKNTMGPGRAMGIFGTQVFLAGMAVYTGYLVKGYWGY